jgi:hypothetical protein
MRTTTGKYDVFSKVFAQLSGESQDKLVKTARRLLKTHQYAQCGTAQQTKKRQGVKSI